VTLDADTVFRRDTVRKLVRHFIDPQVAAVAGNAKVGNRLNLLTNCTHSAPFSLGLWWFFEECPSSTLELAIENHSRAYL
jgi:hypothetical protein